MGSKKFICDKYKVYTGTKPKTSRVNVDYQYKRPDAWISPEKKASHVDGITTISCRSHFAF